LANRLNPVEKALLVVVAYVIAILAVVLLTSSETPPEWLVATAVAVPLVLGTAWTTLRGGLVLSAATVVVGAVLLLTRFQGRSLALPTSLLLVDLGLGLAITLAVHRRERRRERWRRAKSVLEPYDDQIFEHAMNALHLVDKEGTILKRNEASRTMIGFPTKRSLALAEYAHPEDLDALKVELARLFERGEVRDVKARFISEKRTAIPVELKATRVTERVAVMEAADLSQQAELRRRLAETEARYRDLIEEAVDTLDSGILITDRTGQVVWANKAVGRFFGIDRDRLVGVDTPKALSRYVGAFEDADAFRRAVEDASRNGGRIESHTCRVRPGASRDERVLEYRSTPIETERYQGGRIDHYIDITKIKQLEQGLLEKTDHLLKTNEKLEQFSHVVSHDLKEPLRTIEAFSGFLVEDYADRLDEEGVGYLNKLRTTSKRMRELIDDLLKLARIRLDSASFERINLNRVLEEVKEDLEARLRGVSLQVEPDLPAVRGNKTWVRELFANLISNAVKYNDKALPTVHVGSVRDGKETGCIPFFVRDNGIGIEARYHERIFGIFEKLNPREDYEGTGVGLAICKRIVEEHKGGIWVESEVGTGSTFYFTLPKAQARKEGGEPC